MSKTIDGRLARLEHQMGADDFGPVFNHEGDPLPFNAHQRVVITLKQPGSDGPTMLGIAGAQAATGEATSASFAHVSDDELSAMITETRALLAQEGTI